MLDYSKWDKLKFSSSEDESDVAEDFVKLLHDEAKNLGMAPQDFIKELHEAKNGKASEDFAKKLHNTKNAGVAASDDFIKKLHEAKKAGMSSYSNGTSFNFVQPEDLIQSMSDKTSWASSLSKKERHEWIVDCYRMRVDDDNVWNGGYLHGLYVPDPQEGQKLTVIKDFLIFMKLAVMNGVIPEGDCFSFAKCLRKAVGLLPYAFEKSDAKEKYGGENVYSPGPSLRRTGEAVYGTSIMAGSKGDNAKEIEEKVEKSVKKAFHKSKKKIFEDVGGFDIWLKLYKTVKFRS